MLRTALIALALPVAALAQGDVTEAHGLRVTAPRAVVAEGDTAQVYMTIENTGEEPVTLTDVGSPAAEMVTMVASPERSPGVVPETRDGLILPPGVETVLEPEGLYLLLTGIEPPLEEGSAIGLTLTFERLGEIELRAAVEAPEAD